MGPIRVIVGSLDLSLIWVAWLFGSINVTPLPCWSKYNKYKQRKLIHTANETITPIASYIYCWKCPRGNLRAYYNFNFPGGFPQPPSNSMLSMLAMQLSIAFWFAWTMLYSWTIFHHSCRLAHPSFNLRNWLCICSSYYIV